MGQVIEDDGRTIRKERMMQVRRFWALGCLAMVGCAALGLHHQGGYLERRVFPVEFHYGRVEIEADQRYVIDMVNEPFDNYRQVVREPAEWRGAEAQYDGMHILFHYSGVNRTWEIRADRMLDETNMRSMMRRRAARSAGVLKRRTLPDDIRLGRPVSITRFDHPTGPLSGSWETFTIDKQYGAVLGYQRYRPDGALLWRSEFKSVGFEWSPAALRAFGPIPAGATLRVWDLGQEGDRQAAAEYPPMLSSNLALMGVVRDKTGVPLVLYMDPPAMLMLIELPERSLLPLVGGASFEVGDLACVVYPIPGLCVMKVEDDRRSLVVVSDFPLDESVQAASRFLDLTRAAVSSTEPGDQAEGETGA